MSAAPGVDVAGFETGGGEERVAGLGGMGSEQGFGGELAFVPQGVAAVVNATLDVDAAAVGFVDEATSLLQTPGSRVEWITSADRQGAEEKNHALDGGFFS